MITVPPQLSPLLLAVPVLLGSVESPQARVLSSGQWMLGTVVSWKVMCCTQLLVLWQASAAYQVRSMPGLPVQLAVVGASLWVMITVPPQLSPLLLAVPVLLGSVESPQARVLSSGQWMLGTVV